MERRFCSKCGMPLDQCICEDGKSGLASAVENAFSAQKAEQKTSTKSVAKPVSTSRSAMVGNKTPDKFDSITLTQGETVVRQYLIGEFAKGLMPIGTGSASIIITNKRMISKQDSEIRGTSSLSVEEIALDSVVGVKNYYAVGLSLVKAIFGVSFCLSGFVAFVLLFIKGSFLRDLITVLIAFGVGAYLIAKCRKPSYYFSVYANGAGSALDIGVNLRGKLFNSGGYGIVFQYKPTEEVVTMMNEIGACIMDLKAKGDYAINQWKNV